VWAGVKTYSNEGKKRDCRGEARGFDMRKSGKPLENVGQPDTEEMAWNLKSLTRKSQVGRKTGLGE